MNEADLRSAAEKITQLHREAAEKIAKADADGYKKVTIAPQKEITMNCSTSANYFKLAERQGFEPWVRYNPTTVFETAPFNRSGTSPLIE